MAYRPDSWNMKSAGKQSGVVLAVTLVILVGVTIVSISALHSSMMETTMASNEESRVRAFQRAQNGLDAVASSQSNYQVVGHVGRSNCTAGFAGKYGGSCDETTLTLPQDFDSSNLEARVVRLKPLKRCPPRGMETSCVNFSVATFATDSRYDNVAGGDGRSEIVQGYMVLVPELGIGE